jgi:hypothetical protein
MTLAFRVALALLALAGACSSEEAESVTLPAPKGGAYGPAMTLESAAFADGADIPARHTCDGEGVSPPLSWSNVPDGTESFALVVDDPDAPRKVWVHWVTWAIDGEERSLYEGIQPGLDEFVQGRNDSGDNGWTAPCPPEADDAHRYEFHVFAVEYVPMLEPETTRDELYRTLDGRVLAMGELVGVY